MLCLHTNLGALVKAWPATCVSVSTYSSSNGSGSEAESMASARSQSAPQPSGAQQQTLAGIASTLSSPALSAPGLPTAPASSLAPPVQSKLLRQINAYQTKEELLSFVASCLTLLDPINLVTCIYRLARMYSSIRAAEVRNAWKAELASNSTFQLLLRTVQSHLLQAQLQLLGHEEVRGLDARCVSNLVWAAVKLEVACETGALGTELVLTASPLVLFFLDQSSCQGLANLLWSYSKMELPPLDVMMAIVRQMTELLCQPTSAASFDAQALSNSVWALAHIRSSAAELDLVAGQVGCVQAFLECVATAAGRMLSQFSPQLNVSQLQAYMFDREKRFSCQALVNIAWGFATMMGEVCAAHSLFKQLFLQIRHEAIMRLHATSSGLQLNQAWVHRIVGGLNPQALSNITFAYDKVGMLDRELLQWVFNVAALRLARIDPSASGPLEFKAQELCTLMRAAHLHIAQPWAFLSRLDALVAARPHMLSTWTPPELAELDRALQLLHNFKAPLQQQQQQLPLRGGAGLVQPGIVGSSMGAVTLGGASPQQQLMFLAQQHNQQQQAAQMQQQQQQHHHQQQQALVMAQAQVQQHQQQVAAQLQLMQLQLNMQHQQQQQQQVQVQQQQQQVLLPNGLVGLLQSQPATIQQATVGLPTGLVAVQDGTTYVDAATGNVITGLVFAEPSTSMGPQATTYTLASPQFAAMSSSGGMSNATIAAKLPLGLGQAGGAGKDLVANLLGRGSVDSTSANGNVHQHATLLALPAGQQHLLLTSAPSSGSTTPH